MSINLIAAISLAGSAIAQSSDQTQATAPRLEQQIWDALASWPPYTACALLAAGIIFAIYGWRISKVLAVINFGIIGGFLGHYLAGQFSLHVLGSTVGLAAVLAALCAWQNRHGVALLAGGAGGVVGAAACYSFNLTPPWIWAGFLVGFVTFALLAFIVYKIAAMLFSSVEGSALVVAATLSLLSSQESFAAPISNLITSRIYALPVILAVPTIASMIVQHIKHKHSGAWSIDG